MQDLRKSMRSLLEQMIELLQERKAGEQTTSWVASIVEVKYESKRSALKSHLAC